MSSKAKGRRTLNKAKEYLTEQGFIVDEVELGGRFQKYKDLFSEWCDGFDLIALKKGELRLVQIKTNQRPKKDTYIAFARKYASQQVRVYGMTWFDRKGWVIQKFNTTGTITETDLRKK